jgi:hypothetical protein
MGAALVTIKDVKLGRQASVVHVALTQGDREEVVGYVTQTDVSKESGPSFDTNFQLRPPIKSADFEKLAKNEDPNWTLIKKQHVDDFRPAVKRLEMYIPAAGYAQPNIVDEWVRFSSGERFTTASLGFVVDMFPLVVENYYKKNANDGGLVRFWYPTLLINLDVKKALPEEGVEWLFVRAQALQIKNGRMDYNIVVLDQQGEVVALSNHVNYIVDVSRNTAKRRTGGEGSEKDSKI